MKRKLILIPFFLFIAFTPSLFVQSCAKKPNEFNINNYINFNSVRYNASEGKPSLNKIVEILEKQIINYSYSVVASDKPESNQIGIYSFNFNLNTGITFNLKLKSSIDDGSKDIDIKDLHIKMFYNLLNNNSESDKSKNVDGYKTFIKAIEKYLDAKTIDSDDISESNNTKTQKNIVDSINSALLELWSKDASMNWVSLEIKDKDDFVSISGLNISSYVHASTGLSNKTIKKYGLTEDKTKDYILKKASFLLDISGGNFEIIKYDSSGQSSINMLDFNNSLSTIEQKADNIVLDKDIKTGLKNNAAFIWDFDTKDENSYLSTKLYDQFVFFLKDGFYKSAQEEFNFSWDDLLSNNDNDVEIVLSDKKLKITKPEDGSKEMNKKLIDDFNNFFIANATKTDNNKYIFEGDLTVSIDIKKTDDNGLTGNLKFGMYLLSTIKSDKK